MQGQVFNKLCTCVNSLITDFIYIYIGVGSTAGQRVNDQSME